MRKRSAMLSSTASALLLSLVVALSASTGVESAEPERKLSTAAFDFDKTIAPLLAVRCLDCHRGTEAKGGLDLSSLKSARIGGESGKALVPGNLADSLLWQRVADDEMPPEKPLSDTEKVLLKTWIAGGAAWGSDPIDPFRFTTDKRAGYDWWALQPVERPKIPHTKNTSRLQNPIDRFIQAKLEEHRLHASPAADRRTLIRRLSFDLLGLPPDPADVDRFLADASPDAYEQLVERLLASPHYGQRWARHWLDLARFGESQGFERDKLRTNAWRYRDWVVDALNSDMPYDAFCRLQLAGDVLNPKSSGAAIATGFLVAGPYDEVGNSQISAAMKAVVRQDELEDIISVVGQTFLGLTVNCSRCHDHKFDPVTQQEYYRLASALGGVRHGRRALSDARVKADSAARSEAIAARIVSLDHQISTIEEVARRAILAQRKTNPSLAQSHPKAIAEWTFDGDLKDHIGGLHGTTSGGAALKQGCLQLNGQAAYVATVPIPRNLTEKTLEVWVSLENLNQRGGGVMSLQRLDGVVFDAIVFGEKEPRRWMAGSNGFARTQSFHGNEETQFGGDLVHLAVVYHADGTIAAYRNGRPYGTAYQSSGPIRYKANEAQIVFGMRHGPVGGNKMLAGIIDRAKLYDRALSGAEIAGSAGIGSEYVSPKQIAERLTPEKRLLHERWSLEVKHLTQQRDRANDMSIYANQPVAEPGVTHLLIRGNPASKGPAVTPGGVASLKGSNADFGLPSDAPDAPRRKQLARWIAHPNNPLFARVMVNRLWHYHFGMGLVDTPNDFGFNGGRPSHQKLIDWLASELVLSNWSLKQLQRTIVTSATYRQSSRSRPHEMTVNSGNRLLWRKNPMRLEAEVVRDTILSVTGRLNQQIGGPGFHDFDTFTQNTQFYVSRDAIGESFNRRSLYRTWVRSGRNRFLDVFDCPDPSTKTPKRAVTTTPLQALALLNNSFVLRMSDRLAERLEQEAGSDIERQLTLGFQILYGREPDRDELKTLKTFVSQYGLPAACRVLLNTSEFLYVD